MNDWLWRFGPGALPLAALAYSALNSWHCTMMCGPLTVGLKPKPMHRLLAWRVLTYTAMGALMGWGGRWLREALTFQLLNVFAFATFALIILAFVLPQLFPRLPRPRFFWRPASSGLFFALTPCHLLMFYYGLAATVASPALGAALLFGHAVMTTPALAYARVWSGRVRTWPAIYRESARWLVALLILVNMAYLLMRLLKPDVTAPVDPLFCF